MAPLKFEEHIKEKLEQRKLQPQSNAWDRLNERLDTETVRRSKVTYWWLGIAASIVGVFFVVNMIMNSDTEINVPNTVVDSEEVNSQEQDVFSNDQENTPIEIVTDSNNENQEGSKADSQEPTQIKEPSPLKKRIHNEQLKLTPSKADEAVVKTELPELEIEHTKEPVDINSSEQDAINTVVEAMQKLQGEQKSAIDSELDALLSEAQQEIAMEKLYKEALRTVDADALLQGVEQDLDISFRDKVFKALKDSYKTVKTAVAERNN